MQFFDEQREMYSFKGRQTHPLTDPPSPTSFNQLRKTQGQMLIIRLTLRGDIFQLPLKMRKRIHWPSTFLPFSLVVTFKTTFPCQLAEYSAAELK